MRLRETVGCAPDASREEIETRSLALILQLAEERDRLRVALEKVSANCDHTCDCDRAKEWATDATACTCCMRDVEAALSKAKEGR